MSRLAITKFNVTLALQSSDLTVRSEQIPEDGALMDLGERGVWFEAGMVVEALGLIRVVSGEIPEVLEECPEDTGVTLEVPGIIPKDSQIIREALGVIREVSEEIPEVLEECQEDTGVIQKVTGVIPKNSQIIREVLEVIREVLGVIREALVVIREVLEVIRKV